MARNGKTFGRLAAAVVIFAFFTVAAPVRAGENWDIHNSAYGAVGADVVWGTILLVVDGAVAGSGLLNAGVNTYYAAEDKRPPEYLITGGWFSGLLNIALGIATIYVINNDPFPAEKLNDALLGVGISNLVVGALDIGSSVWGGKMPKKTGKSVHVAPLIMQDVEGNPAVGIGLRLVDW